MQYDAVTGWDPLWPQLLTRRSGHGCAAYNRVSNMDFTFSRVIVAGGIDNEHLASSEIFDLDAKTVSVGPEMASARHLFHVVRVERAGVEAVLALGGWGGSSSLDTVEEFLVEEGRWVERQRMGEARAWYGATAVPASLVCR